MSTVNYSSATHIGRVRPENHDTVYTDKDLSFFVVCDGASGAAGASEASKVATEVIRRTLHHNRSVIDSYKAQASKEAQRAVGQLIAHALQLASQTVFDRSLKISEFSGMSTTADVLLIAGHRAFLGHVGDGRIYLQRGHQFYQLTNDHNYQAEMIADGKKTLDQAKKSPFARVLTRSIGMRETV